MLSKLSSTLNRGRSSEPRPYSEDNVLKTLTQNKEMYGFNTCYIIETPESELKPGEFEYKLGFLSESGSEDDSERLSRPTSRCSTPGRLYDRTYSSSESLNPTYEHQKINYFPHRVYPVKAKSTTSLNMDHLSFQMPTSLHYSSSVPSLESSFSSHKHYNKFPSNQSFGPFSVEKCDQNRLSQQIKNFNELNFDEPLNVNTDFQHNEKFLEGHQQKLPRNFYNNQWKNNQDITRPLPNQELSFNFSTIGEDIPRFTATQSPFQSQTVPKWNNKRNNFFPSNRRGNVTNQRRNVNQNRSPYPFHLWNQNTSERSNPWENPSTSQAFLSYQWGDQKFSQAVSSQQWENEDKQFSVDHGQSNNSRGKMKYRSRRPYK